MSRTCPRCGKPDRFGTFQHRDTGVTLGRCHGASCGALLVLADDGAWTDTVAGDRARVADAWKVAMIATAASCTDRQAGAALRVGLYLARLSAVFGPDMIRPSELTMREMCAATATTVRRGIALLAELDLISERHPDEGRQRLELTQPDKRLGRFTSGAEEVLRSESSNSRTLTAPDVDLPTQLSDPVMLHRSACGETATLGYALALTSTERSAAGIAKQTGLPVVVTRRRLAAAADAGLLTADVERNDTMHLVTVYDVADDAADTIAAKLDAAADDIAGTVDNAREARERYEARRAGYRLRNWVLQGVAPDYDRAVRTIDTASTIPYSPMQPFLTPRHLATVAVWLPEGHVLRHLLPAPTGTATHALMELRGVLDGRYDATRAHLHLANEVLTFADAAELTQADEQPSMVQRSMLDRDHPVCVAIARRAGRLEPAPLLVTEVAS